MNSKEQERMPERTMEENEPHKIIEEENKCTRNSR
jgi:hypothetical protein